MFNVAVLKMRDIIKYLVGIIITISVVVFASRYFSSVKVKEKETKKQTKIEAFKLGSLTSCLGKTIPAMSNINKEYNEIEKENEKISETNYLEEFLKTEIGSIKGFEKIEENNNSENINENSEKNEEENKIETEEKITLASTSNTETEVVTQNPISESYNVQYGNVKIKNQTSYFKFRSFLKKIRNVIHRIMKFM